MSEMKLTTAQKAAVKEKNSAVLVSAAAGSGKSSVLVSRLLDRICDENNPGNIDDFLIITFSKKAAAELRSKVMKSLSEKLSECPDSIHLQNQLRRVYFANISTVHSFCGNILREFAYKLNIPSDFRIAEESECTALMKKTLDELLEDRYASIDNDDEFSALVNMLGAGRNDKALSELVLKVFDLTRSFINPEKWLRDKMGGSGSPEGTEVLETEWGRFVLEDFRESVSDMLLNLKKAVSFADEDSEISKKYLPALLDDIRLAEYYLSLDKWDDYFNHSRPSFLSLSPIRKACSPDIKAFVQSVHGLFKKTLLHKLAAFYASEDVIRKETEQSMTALRGLSSVVQSFSQLYWKKKTEKHILDFSDLEQQAVRLLINADDGSPTRDAIDISSRYEEIMVDEYQDTNEVQDKIFRAVSKNGNNRFMVGDVKQSIYRFRRADPEIFVDKYRRYADYTEAAEGSGKRITLSENFRSVPGVLDAANAVFYACMSEKTGGITYSEQEALKPGLELSAYPKVQYLNTEMHCISTERNGENACPKEYAESQFVADRICELLSEKIPVSGKTGLHTVSPKDIVILIRSPKNSAVYYENALQERNIPCVCDVENNIMNTEEIELFVNLLRLTDNLRNDIAMASVMMSPIFRFSAERVAELKSIAKCKGTFSDCILSCSSEHDVDAFLSVIRGFRADAMHLPLHLLLDKMVSTLQLDIVYGAMPDGNIRLSNLRGFLENAAAFEERSNGSLYRFLQHIDSISSQPVPGETKTSPDAVTIMTIHKSKGLEYPVVFLADLSHSFNKEDLKTPILIHQSLGAGCNYLNEANGNRYPTVVKKAIATRLDADSVSEEMRILYVAMTRPVNLLVMTYCAAKVEKKLNAIASDLAIFGSKAAAAHADSLGDWILMTALQRNEAGELLSLLENAPEPSSASRYPWLIRFHRFEKTEKHPEIIKLQPSVREAKKEYAQEMLNFSYLHNPATAVPSKVTATQLKGRLIDEEISKDSTVRYHAGSMRQPELRFGKRELTAAQKGTAMHLAMQYIHLDKTGDIVSIKKELEEMIIKELLTSEQAAAADPEKILQVFSGEIGNLIRAADKVVREFKFTLAVEAEKYYPGATGERMMLQGVSDLCVFKDNRLTVVDFKTDNIEPGTESEYSERYRSQLDTYSFALSRVFGTPVEQRILYYFKTGKAVYL